MFVDSNLQIANNAKNIIKPMPESQFCKIMCFFVYNIFSDLFKLIGNKRILLTRVMRFSHYQKIDQIVFYIVFICSFECFLQSFGNRLWTSLRRIDGSKGAFS